MRAPQDPQNWRQCGVGTACRLNLGHDGPHSLAALPAEPQPPIDAGLPPHTRLILASENLLDLWGTRTERGERITVEWGEPRPEGWYEPVFTVHSDDTLLPAATEPADGLRLDAAWAAAEAALPEGYSVSVSKTVNVSSGPYVATTDYGEARDGYAYADSPAAALLALAAALHPASEEGP